MKTYWNGVEIILDEDGENGLSGGFNHAENFTLEDWGLSVTGAIPRNNFTSTIIRLGSLNDSGPSGHDLSFSIDAVVIMDDMDTQYVFDPDGDGLPASVPEPSSLACILLMATASLCKRQRSDAAVK